ncbi:MAG: AtpZ/AtpI family protein [Anaerolineales bacterium]
MAPKKTEPFARNLTLAAVVGQVGCLTVLIIVAALMAGLWLDGLFGSRPIFIVGLLLASVPVTLILMFWVVRKATSRWQSDYSSQETQQSQEDSDIGTKS